MDKETARKALEKAGQRLKPELADFGDSVGERAIMFRLAHHLANVVGDGDLCADRNVRVDCEYNRHGGDIKILAPKQEWLGDGQPISKRFFPDIVLHQRRSDEHSILVCEIKRIRDSRGCEGDISRLRELTVSDGIFHYDIGVFLEIDQRKRHVNAIYFSDGCRTDGPLTL